MAEVTVLHCDCMCKHLNGPQTYILAQRGISISGVELLSPCLC